MIAITCSIIAHDTGDRLMLPRAYVRATMEAGGAPLLLPPLEADLAERLLSRCDGLLLPGGGDIDPALWGEQPHPWTTDIYRERDELEMGLVRLALEWDMPLLAICRGQQVLNVARGGTLFQDLPSQVAGALRHRQEGPRWQGTHAVRIEPDSTAARTLGATEVQVNSFHHQAVREVPAGLVVSGRAGDGVIECIEAPGQRFVLGVQWHPECMIDHDPAARRLFSALAAAAAEYGAAPRRGGR